MYRLNFNSNTGDIHVIGNLIDYRLSDFYFEGESYNELNVLYENSFVVFLNEKFKLNIIYIQDKLKLINFKLVYESYDEFDLKMESLLGYFDKTQFSNKKVDDVKPYTEYFYNWGVISVYSDLSLNICFSVRWGKEC